MHSSPPSARLSRRESIQWMLAASAALSASDGLLTAAAPVAPAKGYGPDPSMVKIYQPGDVWPLTLDAAQRDTVRALCDLILPADADSPAASAVGVPDFIDEWISAPYPQQSGDRRTLLDGLVWIEAEALRRFQQAFAKLSVGDQTALCEDLAQAKPKPEHKKAATFFKRFRDLAAGGYYTTPEGMKAIGYVGNVPSARFDGPPPEALRHVGLA